MQEMRWPGTSLVIASVVDGGRSQEALVNRHMRMAWHGMACCRTPVVACRAASRLLKSRHPHRPCRRSMNTVSAHATLETTADERIVAALLEKGRVKDADLGRA